MHLHSQFQSRMIISTYTYVLQCIDYIKKLELFLEFLHSRTNKRKVLKGMISVQNTDGSWMRPRTIQL